MRTRTLVAAGVLMALVLAGVVSFYASSRPDGLNRVAADQGFSDSARTSKADTGPLAGYETDGVGNDRLSGGLAGVIGCLVVLSLSTGVALVVRRSRVAH